MEKTRKRIISLDVVRAFALFGILLVHICQYYGFNNEYNCIPQSDFCCYFSKAVAFLLDSKMRKMLSLLFGITFYFLMSKPDYGAARFCKRCLFLMAFGLFNIFFYTTDILLWFGLNGLIVCLSFVWKLEAKWMLAFGTFLILLGPYSNGYCREFLFPEVDISRRYLSTSTVTDIITYPFVDVLKGFIRTFAGTSTLGYIILGYSIAKMGIATNIDMIANKRNAFSCLAAYLFLYLLVKSTGGSVFISLWHLIGVVLYMILIVMVSHKIRIFSELMSKYGKMTLTHYSSQEVLLPCVVATLIIPYRISFITLLLFGLLFYSLQILFSCYWLKRYQYGPIEYLWRKCS